jgi:hypothetical protein
MFLGIFKRVRRYVKSIDKRVWKENRMKLISGNGKDFESQKRRPYHLDTPLLQLSPTDIFTIRDACEGVHITGSIGSGKSSGSGEAFAKSYLSAGFGGLVMCAKPEECSIWKRYAEETGRADDLVIFSADSRWFFNYLYYELAHSGRGGGQTESVVNLFTRIVEIIEGKQEVAGGDQYWERTMKELVRNGVDLLSLGKETITLDDLVKLIADAPQSPQQLADKDWRAASFCVECVTAAEGRELTTRERHDLEASVRYFFKTFATLGDRTRSSIVSVFTSIADILQHGIIWELFCTETNIVPETTYKDGAIIVLDFPIQEYQEQGRIIQGIWKYMFQRAVLRRNVKEYPRPVFLWADESQNFVSSYDFLYQAVARSARACTVYLTQSISNYYSVLGEAAHDETHALLGNFNTKIFHANSDHPTNQYAADLIGQNWMTVYNFGSNMTEEGQSHSGGGSQALNYKVIPSAFTTLRKGGEPNNLEVEAIVFQGGRVWNQSRDTYLNVIFKQQ